MTAANRDPIDRFDAALDALSRGEPVPPDAAEPTLLPAVTRLRALYRAQRAAPQVVDRIWAELMHEAGGSGAASLLPAAPVAPRALNGHATGHPWRAEAAAADTMARRRHRRPPAHLVAAAVLALAVIGSLLGLRFAGQAPEHARTILDAAQAPVVQTFVDTVVENPEADWTPLSIERWTFQPGRAALTIPALKGPQWIVAEDGGIVVSVGGAERRLTPDESLIIPDGQELVVRNTGSVASSVLRGVAVDRFVFEDYDRSAISRQPVLDTQAHEALPPGRSRLVFERLTLLAGTTLLLEPANGQDWLDVAAGRLGMTLLGNGLPRNWQSGREREVSADEMLPALVPGTKITLRNVGDDPLVLLRLRVLPAAEPGDGLQP